MSNVLGFPRPERAGLSPRPSTIGYRVESIFSRHRQNQQAIKEGRIARWEADPEGASVELSWNWAMMLGPDGLVQLRLGWHRLIHPDDRFETLARWHKSRFSGQPYQAISRCWIYGDYRPTVITAYPLLYDHDRVVRWEGYWQPLEMGKAANF